MSRRLPDLAFLLIAFGLLGAGCKKEEGSAPSPEEVPTAPPVNAATVTIGITESVNDIAAKAALKKGFFEKHGISVQLETLANREAVAQALLEQSIDAGLLAPAQLFSATLARPLITPCVVARNGSAIYLSQPKWEAIQGRLLRDASGTILTPVTADALQLTVQTAVLQHSPLVFHVASDFATAHYLLRFWLAAAGLHPGAPEGHSHMRHSVVRVATEGSDWTGSAGPSPFPSLENPQMVITAHEIYKNLPTVALAMTETWAADHSTDLSGVVKGLREGCAWLDATMSQRTEAATLVDSPHARAHLSGRLTVAGQSVTWPDHVTFHRYGATEPDVPSGLWLLTQMIRWGQLPAQTDAELRERATRIFRLDLYEAAGGPSEQPAGGRVATHGLDGAPFDPNRPSAYLKR